MKRVVSLLLLFACLAAALISCGTSKDGAKAFDSLFDKSGNYTGFSNLKTNYTIENAKADGYYVTQDSKVVANEKVWDNFVKDSSNKKNTSVRMVRFYKEVTDGPYFIDIFYQNGHYYLFDSTAETNEKQPYSYLLKLDGRFGNPLKDSSVTVLTDDSNLTFDKVMKSLISSDMEYIKSVSPYRIVLMK